MTKEEMEARVDAFFERQAMVNNIDQALEERRGEPVTESATEKSRKAVLEDIRDMLKKHPEMSNTQIALEVGATPKQVGAQRYLMSEKGKEQTRKSNARQQAVKAAKRVVSAQVDKETPKAEKREERAAAQPVRAFEQYAAEMAAKAFEKAFRAVGDLGRLITISAVVTPDYLRIEAMYESEGEENDED